jgi:hypothetical protein
MKKGSAKNRFEAVNNYALERLRSQGDVFGSAPLENEKRPSALLLVTKDSPLDSFPASIAGIRLILKQISRTEVQEP